MIKELVGHLRGRIGLFNKSEAIALIGNIMNEHIDKTNEMIKVINQLENKIKKLEEEVKKNED